MFVLSKIVENMAKSKVRRKTRKKCGKEMHKFRVGYVRCLCVSMRDGWNCWEQIE